MPQPVTYAIETCILEVQRGKAQGIRRSADQPSRSDWFHPRDLFRGLSHDLGQPSRSDESHPPSGPNLPFDIRFVRSFSSKSLAANWEGRPCSTTPSLVRRFRGRGGFFAPESGQNHPKPKTMNNLTDLSINTTLTPDNVTTFKTRKHVKTRTVNASHHPIQTSEAHHPPLLEIPPRPLNLVESPTFFPLAADPPDNRPDQR